MLSKEFSLVSFKSCAPKKYNTVISFCLNLSLFYICIQNIATSNMIKTKEYGQHDLSPYHPDVELSGSFEF